jgi:hypothetical protein
MFGARIWSRRTPSFLRAERRISAGRQLRNAQERRRARGNQQNWRARLIVELDDEVSEPNGMRVMPTKRYRA